MSDIIRQRIHKQIETIDAATEMVRGDTIPDMSAIDRETGAICREILRQPAAEAKVLQDELEQVISRLDSLEQELRDCRQRLEDKAGH
jgi:vacuolar-type H+-ATPase subunit B/Vma2